MSSAARSRRRRAAQQALTRCQDCNATPKFGAAAATPPGVDLAVTYEHEPTCPWLANNPTTKWVYVLRPQTPQEGTPRVRP